MLLWCYFMTVFTDPGSVPEHWRPVVDEEDTEAQAAPLSGTPRAATSSDTASRNGSAQFQDIRYCRKCSQYKPPRTHHCSVCEYLLPYTPRQSLKLCWIGFFLPFLNGHLYMSLAFVMAYAQVPMSFSAVFLVMLVASCLLCSPEWKGGCKGIDMHIAI